MTPEPIDWRYPVRRDGKRVASDEVNEAADELLDHWRNLAYHLREENRRLRADLDRLKPTGMKWPFR